MIQTHSHRDYALSPSGATSDASEPRPSAGVSQSLSGLIAGDRSFWRSAVRCVLPIEKCVELSSFGDFGDVIDSRHAHHTAGETWLPERTLSVAASHERRPPRTIPIVPRSTM